MIDNNLIDMVVITRSEYSILCLGIGLLSATSLFLLGIAFYLAKKLER